MTAHDPRNTIKPAVFVVIPAYNEAPAIGAAIGNLHPFGYSVIVVDDASSDATGIIARNAGAKVIRHPLNLGQGAALQTGIDYALEHGATHIVTYDADGQHIASDIPLLLEALQTHQADIVLGSRFLGTAIGLDAPRKLLLRLSALFCKLTTGLFIADTQNGLRAMTAATARKIRIRQNRSAHAWEIIAMIATYKLRYVEMPNTVVYTQYSRSKGQSLWSCIDIIIDLVLGKVRR